MFDLPPEPAELADPAEDTALQTLEGILNDGLLARAMAQRRHGKALKAAQEKLEKQALRVRLERTLPGARGSSLDAEAADEVVERIRQVLGVAQRIQQARDEDALKLLPEKIGNADGWCERVERRLKSAWQESVQQEFQASLRLSKLLQKFNRISDAGVKLAHVAAEALGLESYPPTEQDTVRFAKLIAEKDEILSGLEGGEQTKDLLVFLRRVMEDKATLEHVTPHLLAWLREHDALQMLKIQL